MVSREAPVKRGLRAALPIVAGLLAMVGVVSIAQAQEDEDGVDEALVARGGEVFQANCAACHGTRGEGGTGPGHASGPPVRDIELAYFDLTVRTGRMPITDRNLGVYTDMLSEEDRDAVVAYAAARLDNTGVVPTVEPGDASRGQELYVRNCAACHGAAADGGISGAGVFVPGLVGLDGVSIASATRVGPFEMPGFDPAVLDDDDIDDIVGYLALVEESPRTLVGLREVDQAVAGLLALGLAVVVGVVLFIVSRARRWYPHEPEGYHADPPFEARS